MLETKKLITGITASSAAFALFLTGCSANDDVNGDGDSSVEESGDSDEGSLSAEERLGDFWTAAQQSISNEEITEIMEASSESEMVEIVMDNEDLSAAVEEYVLEPDFSDERLEEIGADSNETAQYTIAILPAMLDFSMGLAVNFESGDLEAEPDIENLTSGIHVVSEAESEDEDSDTDVMIVDFVPNSAVDAFSATADGDATEEEIVEEIESNMGAFLQAELHLVDGEWMVDTERTIELFENL